jgi:cyclopropane-fatty-acyl-phospholipid synthase
LGLARAYVAGDIDIEGDVFEGLAIRDALGSTRDQVSLSFSARDRWAMLKAARSLGVIGRPPPPPPEEARLRGGLHSRGRDARAIAHHYDVGNDFYRIVLGPSMTYSCAYWEQPGFALEDAQEAKYELICRKLGLHEGMRLLDVGCGWGGMVLHAARRHGVQAVGITISEAQADAAAKRVAEAGLTHRVEIRLQDYRDVSDGPFDAISSIGMFEHVGLRGLSAYFTNLSSLLAPRGRLLNHAISKPSGKAGFNKNSFIPRYVFPDGELQEVGRVVTAMQELGLEVRDVESLREHYARTLRAWVANLEAEWDRAVELAGPARARIWRLYMAGSALGFEAGRINIHQVLAVKPDPGGASGMPPTRAPLIDSVES